MKFEDPKMNIIEFNLYDVIATSGDPEDDGPVIEGNDPRAETQAAKIEILLG